ncbi:hypothetical protein QWZ16_17615 [Vibrio ostreicida]|uniref:Lipase n=2 Tax=Vibrio ostreicida TaxID=526588 RepID=A0ABT8BZE7_9VIBR|nr:hypothetical protein [Vibrio ostreicida]MDN3611420.1 hypothetical protein [Vibrio ostreicida]
MYISQPTTPKNSARLSFCLLMFSALMAPSAMASSTYVEPDFQPLAEEPELVVNKVTSEQFLPYERLAQGAFVSMANVHQTEDGYRRINTDEARVIQGLNNAQQAQNVSFPPYVDVDSKNKTQLKYIDKKTGLMATVLMPLDEQDNRVILAFAGTDTRFSITSGRTARGVLNSASAYNQISGLLPDDFKQAEALAEAIKAAYPDKELITTGTSLGGGLAQYAAMLTDSDAYAFNALGLGTGSIEKIMKKRQFNNMDELNQAAHETITNVNLEGEALTYLFGWYMPPQLGDIYTLPFCKGEDDWYQYLTSNRFYLHNIPQVIDNLECVIIK